MFALTLVSPDPEAVETARRRLYGNYLIIYDLDDSGVIVLTVVHAARDLDRLI